MLSLGLLKGDEDGCILCGSDLLGEILCRVCHLGIWDSHEIYCSKVGMILLPEFEFL